jgi:hypothetical protein
MKSLKGTPLAAASAVLPMTHDLSQLFGEHNRRVLTAAYRITGSMADAEDVAQVVFMRLASTSEPVANARSYLYRAAINGALDLLRRRKSAATEPLEGAAGVAIDRGGQLAGSRSRKPRTGQFAAHGDRRIGSARSRNVHPALSGRFGKSRDRRADGNFASCRRCHASQCTIEIEETTHGIGTGKTMRRDEMLLRFEY